MTDVAIYVVLAWVLSTLGAGLACYWVGWRDRAREDREEMAHAANRWLDGREQDRRGPWDAAGR